MPTYDYQCQHCGHMFELFQQMSDPVKKKCPECSTLKLKRLVGAGAGVMFKGSGFYETDYRTESYKKGEKKAKEASKPSEKKAESSKKTPRASSPKPKND